jgi:tetratricopeptide (TPR) repeat protein
MRDLPPWFKSMQTERIAALVLVLALAAACLLTPAGASTRMRGSAASGAGNQGSNQLALQALQRRYRALTAATAAGDPGAVADASRKLSALALQQIANLRLLVGAYPQAVELYRRSIELEDVPETRMFLVIASLRAGQAGEAAIEAGKFLETNPNSAPAWFLKGKAEMAKEDYRSAADSLQHSLQVTRDANAEYALGLSFLTLGEKTKAERVFQQMLAEYGDRAIWHVVFAGAYRESKHPDDAIREFRHAIALDPRVGHAYFFLGVSLLEQNHWAQTSDSMAAFREAVEQDPNDYFSNFYLGVGEAQFKLFDQSNAHLKVAAAIQPQTPETWLYLGLNAFQQQNYKDAKENLLKAVELTGKDESRNNYQIRRAYIALGRMEFIAGNQPEAEKYIQHAKEMQNKSLANSADSISETVGAGSGMQQGAAVLPYIKVPSQPVPQEATPADASARIDPSTLAQTPLNESQQQEAKEFEKQLRQILSSSLNDWGTSEARRGQYQEALAHFHEAERWDNSTAGLMRNTGIAALKVGDIQEAIRALDLAVQVDPQDKPARIRLAMTLFRADQYAPAKPHFEALQDDVFSDPTLAYAWSYTLVRLNEQKKASEVLARTAVLATSPEMLVSIGDLDSVLEDYEHAVSAYKKALELNPRVAKARFKMGAALLRLDRPQAAIAPLEAELSATPDDPDVKYNLAYALLQTSQKERALALLRSLIAAHPEHPQAQYQLGKTLLDDGQVPEAVQHLEIAAKLDPERDYIHYQLQSAYRRNGQQSDAERELVVYRGIKARKRDKVTIPMPERVQ